VEQQPLDREARAQGDRQLAAGADVQRQALLGHPAGDSRTEKSLARVVDVAVREGVAPGPAAAAEVVLVQDVGRGAVLGSEGSDVDAADP